MSGNKNYRVDDSGDENRPEKRRKIDDIYDYITEQSEQSEGASEEIEPYLECCVCLCSDLNDLAILVNNEAPMNDDGFHPVASLADCDEGIPLENTVFLSCCREHGICYNSEYEKHHYCNRGFNSDFFKSTTIF